MENFSLSFVRFVSLWLFFIGCTAKEIDFGKNIQLDFETNKTEVMENVDIFSDGHKVGELKFSGLNNKDEKYYYLLKEGKDALYFEVRNNNELYILESPNFEVKKQYEIDLELRVGDPATASSQRLDSKNSLSKTLVIDVTDVNEMPTSIFLDLAEIYENHPINGFFSKIYVTDEDQNESFKIFMSEGQSDQFLIEGDQLILKNGLIYSENKVINIKIKATDKGDLTFEQEIAIAVKDFNYPPLPPQYVGETRFNAGDKGKILGKFSSSDPDNEMLTFSFIDNSNQTPYLILNSQTGELTVRDLSQSGASLLGKTMSIPIKVKDGVNEAVQNFDFKFLQTDTGNITFSGTNTINFVAGDINLTTNVYENIPKESEVIELAMPGYEDVKKEISIINRLDSNSFGIKDGNRIYILESPDFERKSSYEIDLEIKFLDFQGMSSFVVGKNLFNVKLLINVLNLNDPPTDITIDKNEISEDHALNGSFAKISAVDQDQNEKITFTMATNPYFAIRNGSEIYLKKIISYLALNGQPISFKIVASDDEGGTFEKNFSITVKDVDVNPTIPFTLAFASGINANSLMPIPGLLIGSFNIVDIDNENYSFVIKNPPLNSWIEVINDNQLKIINTTLTANSQSRYELNVEAVSKATGKRFSNPSPFVLTFATTNLPPTLTYNGLSSFNERVSVPYKLGEVSAVDPENDQFTFTLSGTDAALFSLVDLSPAIINKKSLNLKTVVYFHTKPTLNIKIDAKNSSGQIVQSKSLSFSVSDFDYAPTNLVYSGIKELFTQTDLKTPFILGKFSVTHLDSNATDPISYSVVSGNDFGYFGLNGTSGELSLIKNPEIGATPKLVIEARDKSGQTTRGEATFIVTDKNNQPTTISYQGTFCISSGTTGNLKTFITNDADTTPDIKDRITYSLISQTPASKFSLASGNILKLNSAAIYDPLGDNIMTIIIGAYDRSGISNQIRKEFVFRVTETVLNCSTSTNVPIITYTGIDQIRERKEITPLLLGSVSVVPVNSLLEVDSTADSSYFNLTSGQLNLTKAVSYDDKKELVAVIKATNGAVLTRKKIIFSILDTNYPPVDLKYSGITTIYSKIISERQTSYYLGAFSVTNSDINDPISYLLVGEGSNFFEIKNGNKLYLKQNISGVPSFKLDVKATDSAQQSTQSSFTFQITEENKLPTAINFSGSTSLPENMAVNSNLGTFSTDESDPFDQVTYEIIDQQPIGFFSLSGTGGNNLKLVKSLTYDMVNSLNNILRFKVRVFDRAKSESPFTKEMMFSITDVNYPPTAPTLTASSSISGTGPYSAIENLALGTLIGTLSSTDPDVQDSLTFEISSSNNIDHTYFSINQETRQIKLAKLLPTYVIGQPNKLNVIFKVKDKAGLYSGSNLPVVFNISNYNSPPSSVSYSGTSVFSTADLGQVIGRVTGVDPDGDLLTFSFGNNTLENDYFVINKSTGDLTVKSSITNLTPQNLTIAIKASDTDQQNITKSFLFEFKGNQGVINYDPSTCPKISASPQPIYGVSSIENKVYQIDTETDRVIASISVGANPGPSALDKHGNFWVINQGDNSISCIKGNPERKLILVPCFAGLTKINVGNTPFSITTENIDETSVRVFVLSSSTTGKIINIIKYSKIGDILTFISNTPYEISLVSDNSKKLSGNSAIFDQVGKNLWVADQENNVLVSVIVDSNNNLQIKKEFSLVNICDNKIGTVTLDKTDNLPIFTCINSPAIFKVIYDAVSLKYSLLKFSTASGSIPLELSTDLLKRTWATLVDSDVNPSRNVVVIKNDGTCRNATVSLTSTDSKVYRLGTVTNNSSSLPTNCLTILSVGDEKTGPRGVSTGSQGEVYVVTSKNGEIHRFDGKVHPPVPANKRIRFTINSSEMRGDFAGSLSQYIPPTYISKSTCYLAPFYSLSFDSGISQNYGPVSISYSCNDSETPDVFSVINGNDLTAGCRGKRCLHLRAEFSPSGLESSGGVCQEEFFNEMKIQYSLDQ